MAGWAALDPDGWDLREALAARAQLAGLDGDFAAVLREQEELLGRAHPATLRTVRRDGSRTRFFSTSRNRAKFRQNPSNCAKIAQNFAKSRKSWLKSINFR